MIQETDPGNLYEGHDHIEDIEDIDIEDNENDEEEMGKELLLTAICALATLHLGMAIMLFHVAFSDESSWRIFWFFKRIALTTINLYFFKKNEDLGLWALGGIHKGYPILG